MKAKKKRPDPFVKSLRESLVKITAGCNLQHTGWPCNSCFHHSISKRLNLSQELTHKFWHVVLVIRGDTTEESIKSYEQEQELNHTGISSSIE